MAAPLDVQEVAKYFVSTRREGKTAQVLKYLIEKMEQDPTLKVRVIGENLGYKLLLPPKFHDRLILDPRPDEGPLTCSRCGMPVRTLDECSRCDLPFIDHTPKNICATTNPIYDDPAGGRYEVVNGKRIYFEIVNGVRIDEADYGIDHLLIPPRTVTPPVEPVSRIPPGAPNKMAKNPYEDEDF